jgi:hypothetical protein
LMVSPRIRATTMLPSSGRTIRTMTAR